MVTPSPRRPSVTAGIALLIGLIVSGCATVTPVPESDSQPELRIAALSYDVAETIAALGHADSLVLVPRSAKNPAMTNYAEALAQVPNELVTEADLDPEVILATAPELILHTPRQRDDAGAATMLDTLGIEVLSIDNTWGTIDEVYQNIATIGAAIDDDAAATDLIETIRNGLTNIEPRAAGTEVLILSNQQQAFAVGSGAFPSYLVGLTGATLSSTELNIAQTRPIDAELVVKANPDAIILIDLHGTERDAFESLLGNPAVASLDVVKQDRILVLQGRQIQALALAELPTTIHLLNNWLALPTLSK